MKLIKCDICQDIQDLKEFTLIIKSRTHSKVFDLCSDCHTVLVKTRPTDWDKAIEARKGKLS